MVDVALVEVGRVRDGLPRRGYQFVWRSRYVKPGGVSAAV